MPRYSTAETGDRTGEDCGACSSKNAVSRVGRILGQHARKLDDDLLDLLKLGALLAFGFSWLVKGETLWKDAA